MRQQTHVEAVLVHDGEPLHAAILRARLVDEHDARVEVAQLAGELLVDLVGDDVTDAAPILRAGGEALTGELPAGGDVPEAELRDDAAVGAALDIADNERVGANGAPIGKARRGVDVAHLLEKRAAVERLEEARVAEVGLHHVGDVGGELGVGPEKERNGDRNRRDGALRLPALQTAAGRVPPRKPPPPPPPAGGGGAGSNWRICPSRPPPAEGPL